MLLPTDTSIMAGGLRLSGYRILLILLFPMLVMRVFATRQPGPRIVDWLVLVNGAWAFTALTVHHGINRGIEAGGIYIVELVGAYCIARAYVRTPAAYMAVVRCVFLILAVLLPLALIESFTGVHVMRQLFAAGGFSAPMDKRFGLERAFGPFDHPILFGVFAGSAIAMIWYAYGDRKPSSPGGIMRTGVAAVAAATSLSSGAIAATMIQLGLSLWERLTRRMPGRWVVLGICSIVGYFAIDLVSNRSGIRVLLSYLTFSPATAYNRLIIWDWGFNHNVLVHPVFGIGQNVWVRPEWMHSTSMDNFWLVQMVTYGVPAFLALAAAVIVSLACVPKNAHPDAARLRKGWAISMVGLIIAGCTVHFWNHSFVWFCFLLGLAGAFHAPSAKLPPRRPVAV